MNPSIQHSCRRDPVVIITITIIVRRRGVACLQDETRENGMDCMSDFMATTKIVIEIMMVEMRLVKRAQGRRRRRRRRRKMSLLVLFLPILEKQSLSKISFLSVSQCDFGLALFFKCIGEA